MAGASASETSMTSTPAIPLSSKTMITGNRGVITSVLWLVAATGLCFPWLVERRSASKSEETARSVGWYAVLALDLVFSMGCIFSLWFRKSAMSMLLLIWGSFGILATFLFGSFAMLPAVATMCCCAPQLCIAGAADLSPLDDHFCYVPLDMCMKTRWALWCYYGGILLAMVAMVLLINAVGFHYIILIDYENQQKVEAKAARASFRERRRRQDLWEQEVFGYAPHSSRTLRGTSPLNFSTDCAATPRQHRGLESLLVAPASRSPSVHSGRSSASIAVTGDDGIGTALPTPSAPSASIIGDGVEEQQRMPSSASAGSSSVDGGMASHHGRNDAQFFMDGKGGVMDEEEGRRVRRSSPARSIDPLDRSKFIHPGWMCADEENGGGRITPKTALRFKTSALARAIHN